MMNKKMAAFFVGGIAVLGAGGYAAFDYYAGNHITVQEVIPSSAVASAQDSAAPVVAELLNGQWNIKQPDSKVYFSVTTSKETVNFEASSVAGQWTLDTADPGNMQAEATVALDSLTSGNDMRDTHVKEARFLDAAAFPYATFALTSFEHFPTEWVEGKTVSFEMNGTLTMKGISKDVTFAVEALYSGGEILMEGNTVVTFADFGMENPHTVVMETENNVAVQTQLVLEKA
ncbi:YceI family protein [Paenibacillus sp.]|uniref:YceI family protein n=1 Tax=Paenibacillus sp. TaxID=58172 RepID=UPI002D405ADB|nr:YceI family protein [Paenibacillus sp.]HZG88446.1 YceI family protein [Paenibacillus sp.]